MSFFTGAESRRLHTEERKTRRGSEYNIFSAPMGLLFMRFLPRDVVLTRYVLSSCVRLSVCLSVTRRSSTKMAKPKITKSTPYDSPDTLFFDA